MFRVLKEDKLLQTAENLAKRVRTRFPDSGLAHVADEVVQVIRESVVRAESIRRPNWLLRAGLVLLGLLAIGGVFSYIQTSTEQGPFLSRLLQFLDASKGVAAYLAGVALFLVTLEIRLKRRRALQAIHELRAVAHVIDMHQLTKDPDRLGDKDDPLTVGSRVLTSDGMGRYLHFCTEMLSLISKVGQLYVQDLPDSTAEAAVDQFENLATGLSSKIWQKIIILDQVRGEVRDNAEGVPLGQAAATAKR